MVGIAYNISYISNIKYQIDSYNFIEIHRAIFFCTPDLSLHFWLHWLFCSCGNSIVTCTRAYSSSTSHGSVDNGFKMGHVSSNHASGRKGTYTKDYINQQFTPEFGPKLASWEESKSSDHAFGGTLRLSPSLHFGPSFFCSSAALVCSDPPQWGLAIGEVANPFNLWIGGEMSGLHLSNGFVWSIFAHLFQVNVLEQFG